MDRLRAIEYFVKVADLGSFSEAARATGTPASSISRRVRDLEEELGTTLLHRTTRDVRLTELGALYLDQVRSVLERLNDAKDAVACGPDSASGSLRISAMPGFSIRLLPALKKLRSRYPDLVVDVDHRCDNVDLAKNEVDLCVRGTGSPPERSVARKLTRNDFKLVGSSDYLEEYGSPQSIADLESHRAILWRDPTRTFYWQVKSNHAWKEVRANTTFVSNDGFELLAEAIEGKGLTLFPDWFVEDAMANGTLVDATPQDIIMSINREEDSFVYLLYNRPRYRLEKIKRTVEFLVSELQDETVKSA